ncbi:MAG: lipid-binding protein [Candidatus Cryptobacteroides sp.]
MKNIVKLLICVAGILSLVSCETYKVKDPDMTAVSDFDGRWVCFAYDKSDLDNPAGLYVIEITNTTFNDADKFWMTVTDCDPVYGRWYYLDALRFKTECDGNSLTFNASEAEAEQPRTCYNIYLEQSYYTYGTAGISPVSGYKVTVSNGKVTKDGVDTATGYKADAIEFDYKRTDPSGTVTEYHFSGMKNTGWSDDMVEFNEYLDQQGWW